MKISKIVISVLTLFVFAFVATGCPPGVIKKSNPYVKDAKKFVNDVGDEYPTVSAAIKDACGAELLDEEVCTDFDERIDPAIIESIKLLDNALVMYQEAVTTYEDALSSGTEEEINDNWIKVSAALNSIVTQLGEATNLYFDAVKVYNTLKVD